MRRVALTLLVLTVLAGGGDAFGGVTPIIGGDPANPGEYPAQGALFINLNGNAPPYEGLCGGSLVGSRYFLTAAHCVFDDQGHPVSASDFLVVLGVTHIDLDNPPAGNQYPVPTVVPNEAFDSITFHNDTAMLKLSQAAPYAPLRVIRTDEASKWAPGTTARIIGWGTTLPGGGGPISNDLLEANVPIISDSECAGDYPGDFDANTMVCAYDGLHDTCQGDSGGPLMVPDGGGGFVLAGITSWGLGCANQDAPGVYTRLGAPGVNSWVMARFPHASFAPGPAMAGAPVLLTSTSYHPDGPLAFTTFRWDLNGDNTFGDATGATVTTTFQASGTYRVGLEASNPAGDVAVAVQDVVVAVPPPGPPPPPAPPAPPAQQARCAVPKLRGKTLAGARAALTRAKCRLGAVTRAYSSAVRRGRVIRQVPPAGARRIRGTRVSVIVSRGKRRR